MPRDRPGGAVNRVIRERIVKQQQMRWSPEGAHLPLHVRTQVLAAIPSSKPPSVMAS
jgi:hypothetical protein